MQTKLKRWAAGVAVTASLLGACGDPTTVAGAPGDPDQPISSSPGQDGPPGGGGPQTVTPRPGMADVHPVAWRRSTADGSSVTVRFYSGVEPCNVLDRVEVAETDASVTITLYEGSDPARPGAACIELAVLKAVTVELDRPLGDRRLIDGAKKKHS